MATTAVKNSLSLAGRTVPRRLISSFDQIIPGNSSVFEELDDFFTS